MDNVISANRTFHVSPQRAYDAWTTPEQFAYWFGTDQVTIPLDTVKMDLRPGGKWAAQMHLPDGNVINWVGEYRELDPGNRIAMTITDQPDDPAQALLEVDFNPESDGDTNVAITQEAPGFSAEQIKQTEAGYNSFFDSMATLFERR